jgi:hypothetical protein
VNHADGDDHRAPRRHSSNHHDHNHATAPARAGHAAGNHMRRLGLLIACLLLVACGSKTTVRYATAHPRAPVLLAGSPIVGQVLTSSTGTWTNNPTSFAYQWQRCTSNCTNLPGATGNQYTIAAADVGTQIDVIVTASNAGGSASQTSARTAAVAASGTCTVTDNSLSSVNSQLQIAGTTVCLAAGAYGAVSLTAAPTSTSTLTAAPGAHVVVAGLNITGSHLTVSQLHSTGGMTINNGGSNDTLDHNDITNPGCGYGASVFGTWTGSTWSPVATNDTISNNLIHDTGNWPGEPQCEADAQRADGYKNLTLSGNDVYHIAECSTPCHTDTFQSYQAGVPTTGLTITREYIHDTVNAAGTPFLKDGDVTSGVSITDNLELRMPTNGEISGFNLHENTQGLTFRNNTYLGTTGSVLQGGGSTPSPSILLDHNVIDQVNQSGTTGYAITSAWNIFTASNQFAWPDGPTDTLGTPPGGYRCAPNCGNGTAAGDDYELATNPNGIGIDWSPAAQTYGPSS